MAKKKDNKKILFWIIGILAVILIINNSDKLGTGSSVNNNNYTEAICSDVSSYCSNEGTLSQVEQYCPEYLYNDCKQIFDKYNSSPEIKEIKQYYLGKGKDSSEIIVYTDGNQLLLLINTSSLGWFGNHFVKHPSGWLSNASGLPAEYKGTSEEELCNIYLSNGGDSNAEVISSKEKYGKTIYTIIIDFPDGKFPGKVFCHNGDIIAWFIENEEMANEFIEDWYAEPECSTDSDCSGMDVCNPVCRDGSCYSLDNKPDKPCVDAQWDDYPTCEWNETKCNNEEDDNQEEEDNIDLTKIISWFNSNPFEDDCNGILCANWDNVLFWLALVGIVIYFIRRK